MSGEQTVCLILGLGESGLAMAQWYARQGKHVRVADSRPSPPGAQQLAALPQIERHFGSFDETLLEGVASVALSPGLALSEPIVQVAVARGIPILGEIEIFAQALQEQGVRTACKILAITGTNGKTTTTVLTGELCRQAGRETAVAGNISPSALTELMARMDAGRLPDVWVLELSSFQLETTYSLRPDAAVVLNLSEDHLDRHTDMSEYAAAKARIYAGNGAQIVNRQDAAVMDMVAAGRTVYSFGLDEARTASDFGLLEKSDGIWLSMGREALIRCDELALAGRHNVMNALAALALGHAIDLPIAEMLTALRGFKGLPHRVQQIARRADGVIFYDDSKGTNVGATIAAIEGLGKPVVLIAGGEGKGQDFAPLRDVLARCAVSIVLIGRDAHLIEEAVHDCGVPIWQAREMDEAVTIANEAAGAGQIVLLSPACASFDMFKNYAHRAEVFTGAVLKLPGVEAV